MSDEHRFDCIFVTGINPAHENLTIYVEANYSRKFGVEFPTIYTFWFRLRGSSKPEKVTLEHEQVLSLIEMGGEEAASKFSIDMLSAIHDDETTESVVSNTDLQNLREACWVLIDFHSKKFSEIPTAAIMSDALPEELV